MTPVDNGKWTEKAKGRALNVVSSIKRGIVDIKGHFYVWLIHFIRYGHS